MDGRERWRVVYNDLRDLIEQGKYAPGQQLPAERDLVDRYKFSRATVRNALARLEQAGLVTAGSGSLGRTVRKPLEISFDASKFEVGAYRDDEVRGVDQWMNNVEEQGWDGRQTVTVTTRTAPPQVTRWLAVEPDTPPGAETSDTHGPEVTGHRVDSRHDRRLLVSGRRREPKGERHCASPTGAGHHNARRHYSIDRNSPSHVH